MQRTSQRDRVDPVVRMQAFDVTCSLVLIRSSSSPSVRGAEVIPYASTEASPQVRASAGMEHAAVGVELQAGAG